MVDVSKSERSIKNIEDIIIHDTISSNKEEARQ